MTYRAVSSKVSILAFLRFSFLLLSWGALEIWRGGALNPPGLTNEVATYSKSRSPLYSLLCLVLFFTIIFVVSDFAFAKTLFGKPVGFGTAGDCYSRNNCPQVRPT